MYKNIFNTKALPIAMSMALVSTSVVAVEISNHAGAICNNANASDAVHVNHGYNGTTGTSPIRVTCPLVRKTTSTFGARIKVDISHNTNVNTYCTAFSYNPNGTLLAAFSAVATGIGNFSLSLNLSGGGNSTPLSYYSVLCSIQAINSTILRGIRLEEFP